MFKNQQPNEPGKAFKTCPNPIKLMSGESRIPEIPAELRPVLEIVYEGDAPHIRCKYRDKDGKECGALFFSLSDAVRHLAMHDSKYRRFLIHLST